MTAKMFEFFSAKSIARWLLAIDVPMVMNASNASLSPRVAARRRSPARNRGNRGGRGFRSACFQERAAAETPFIFVISSGVEKSLTVSRKRRK